MAPPVRPLRRGRRPGARDLLYPFIPAEEIGSEHLVVLRALFDQVEPFAFELVSPGRFPGVLYLRLDPEAPIRVLIEAIQRRFPDHPPYGGAFDEVIPHLTVADIDDEDQLTDIESGLSIGLPVGVDVDEAASMTEQRGGAWRVAETFPFGGP